MVDAGRGRAQFETMALRRLEVRQDTPLHPAYVVWELTLACDQPCTHCGSRAGDARANELSTDEALEVVEQLAAAGAREVVLIGGEAYLHPGFLDIIAALARAGVRPTMTTGGRGITPALAASMKTAGLALRVGQHRRARAHARPDARLPGQLRVRHRGAAAPARGGPGHVVEHQHQPAQRRRSRGALRSPRRARDLVVAGPAHRAARPRRRSARSPVAALGPARRRSPRRRAQAQGARRRHPGDAREQPRLLRPRGGDPPLAARPTAAITGKAARPAASSSASSPTARSKAAPRCRPRTTSAATSSSRRSRTSGATRPSWPSPAGAPSTICGASAAPAPSPRPAWAAAPSPRTPSSAVPATTPTATTARGPSRAAAAASASSPRPRRRVRPSTTGRST